MARALWLPNVLRSAGLTVHEVSGWRTRGSETFDPVAVVAHATAGSRNSSDQDEINVLLTGSPTAPPPIAQLYLGRQGHWWVVASGRCNHIGNAALPGTGRAGNGYAIGIEAANDNRGESWSTIQYISYLRGVAAICSYMGWSHTRVFGHKEISSSGKTDPSFNMDIFRDKVRAIMAGGDEALMAVLTDAQVRKMFDYIDKMGWVFVHRDGAWSLVRGMASALAGIAQIQAGVTSLLEQVRSVAGSTGMTPEQTAALEAVIRDAFDSSALQTTVNDLKAAAIALQRAAEEPVPPPEVGDASIEESGSEAVESGEVRPASEAV